ncbi:MAG: CBS domain-containing protein [Candidatus Anstonellales archaeon]
MSSNIPVSEVMKRKTIVIDVEESVEKAAKVMKANDVGSIIVTDRGAVGIVTERDICWKVVAEGHSAKTTKVKQIMSTPLKTIEPTATLEQAAEKMKKEGVKRLVVLNKHQELVGIISYSDILKILPAVIDIVEERARIEKD